MLSCEIGYSAKSCIPCLPPGAEMVTDMWMLASQDAYRKSITREFMSFVGRRFGRLLAELQGAPDDFSLPPRETGRSQFLVEAAE